MKKTETNPMLKSTQFTVTGSFAPFEFRFHQGSAKKVEELIAKNEGVAPLRVLPSVVVRTHQGYVGTNSVHLNDKDMKDTDQVARRMENNPGARDIASMDSDKDTLVVLGAVKFVANYGGFNKSDSPAYAAYQAEFVKNYLADGNLPVLMKRYLSNLVTGVALWRNRYGFARTTVFTLRGETGTPQHFVVSDVTSPEFETLVAKAAEIAKKKHGYFLLEVAMCVELGMGAEVYPSQPFIDGPAKLKLRNLSKDVSYGRVLSTLKDARGEDQVVFSNNKIGNALRRVDFGYAPDAVEPIAVELYGAVASEQTAHRLGANSYFELVTKKTYETMSEEDRHFVMGAFIKGGMFGFSKDKDAKGKGKADEAVEGDE